MRRLTYKVSDINYGAVEVVAQNRKEAILMYRKLRNGMPQEYFDMHCNIKLLGHEVENEQS